MDLRGRFPAGATGRLPAWLQRLPRWAWILLGLAAVGLGALSTLGGAQSQPSAPGLPGSDTVSAVSMGMSVLFKLGIVVLLIYVSLFLLKRWGGGSAASPQKRLAVLESAHLSPRQALHLVRVGDQLLLIGATDQAVNVLAQVDGERAENPQVDLQPLDEPAPEAEKAGRPAQPAAVLPSFAALLGNAFQKR